MKKLIPIVLGGWAIALIGCTTTPTETTTTTTSTTTQRQPSAHMDPTLDNTRSSNSMNLGPR